LVVSLLLLRTAGDVSVDELKRVAAKGEGLTVRTAALGREVLVNSGDVAAGDLERVAGFVDLPLEVREVGIGTDDSGAEALAAALVVWERRSSVWLQVEKTAVLVEVEEGEEEIMLVEDIVALRCCWCWGLWWWW
jgi:hypothetical protein